MAQNSQFSLDTIGRGSKRVATDLAIIERNAAVVGTAKTGAFARITKISIKAITIR